MRVPAEEKVSRALQLLMAAGGRTLSVKEATDIIELVTKVPENIKAVIARGLAEGLIEREGGRLVIVEKGRPGKWGFDYPGRVRKACQDHCIRCGRRITSCHYIVLEDWQVGPLGSECVKKLRLG
ncbi:MAG: hypothetical protein GXO65_05130 [Euryarchaeota archaeon]|nr:hypothetical protein [Euryarchaeota archaeon]